MRRRLSMVLGLALWAVSAAVPSGWTEYAPPEAVVINGRDIWPGETFTVTLFEQDHQVKLVRITGWDRFEIEYFDLLSVPSSGNPGPCEPVTGKTYVAEISEGMCLTTNTCDANDTVCFEDFQSMENRLIVELQYQPGQGAGQ